MSVDLSILDLLIEQASGDVSVLSELLSEVACDGKVNSSAIHNELLKRNVGANNRDGIVQTIQHLLIPNLPLPPIPSNKTLMNSSKEENNSFKRQEDVWFSGGSSSKKEKKTEPDKSYEQDDLAFARRLAEAEENSNQEPTGNIDKSPNTRQEQDDLAFARSLVNEESNGVTQNPHALFQHVKEDHLNSDLALAKALAEAEDHSPQTPLTIDSIMDSTRAAAVSSSCISPRFGVSSTRQNHPLNEVKDILGAIQASHSINRTNNGILNKLNSLSSTKNNSMLVAEKFKDVSFLPGEIGCEMPARQGQQYEWARPELVEVDIGTGQQQMGGLKQWCLFDGDPSADDVCQGTLGDCWFLSALSVLAEYDSGNLIRNLLPFQGPQVSPYGAYVVRLCKGGCWEHMVVDDELPTTGGHVVSSSWVGVTKSLRQLAFAGTRGCRLWPAIVEKAYAKMCGGYANLSGGGSVEALHVLTGWPSRSIKLQQNTIDSSFSMQSQIDESSGRGINEDDVLDDDMLWSTLLSAKDAGHVLCASTNENVQLGLQPSHAYAVTQVYEITTDYTTGQVARLLCLRNPHGRGQGWSGDWGDSSSLWTSELKQVCSVPKQGSFWISLRDLRLYFHEVVVCKTTRQNWVEARSSGEMRASFASLKGTPPQPDHLGLYGFKLEVFARTEVIIDVAQDFPRFSTQSTSDLSLLVLRVPSPSSSSSSSSSLSSSFNGGGTDKNISTIKEGLPCGSTLMLSTPTTMSSNAFCETWLDPGYYLLVPMTFNNCKNDSENRPFSIAVMSSQPISMDKCLLDNDAARKCACLYVSDPSKCNKKHWQGATISTRKDGCSFYSHVSLAPTSASGGSGGNGWGLSQMLGQVATPIRVEIGFEATSMCHCRSPSFSGNLETSDVIQPGEEQLIAVVYPIGTSSAYRFSYKYQTLPHFAQRGISSHLPDVHPNSLFHPILTRS